MEIQGTALNIAESRLNDAELRFWTLFWDDLLWPSSRSIYIESGPDEKFLEQEGILRRPDYTVSGDVAQGMLRGYLRAYADLSAKEPDKWALAEGDNALLVREKALLPESGLDLVLHRALVVPDRQVPLNEILEFRRRRYPELHSLRLHLDGIAANVAKAENQESELQKQIRIIDENCRDMMRVGAEWQFPISLSSLRVSFDPKFKGLIPILLGASAASFDTGYQQALGISAAAWGVAEAMLKFEAGPTIRSPIRSNLPFRYVSRIYREL